MRGNPANQQLAADEPTGAAKSKSAILTGTPPIFGIHSVSCLPLPLPLPYSCAVARGANTIASIATSNQRSCTQPRKARSARRGQRKAPAAARKRGRCLRVLRRRLSGTCFFAGLFVEAIPHRKPVADMLIDESGVGQESNRLGPVPEPPTPHLHSPLPGPALRIGGRWQRRTTIRAKKGLPVRGAPCR